MEVLESMQIIDYVKQADAQVFTLINGAEYNKIIEQFFMFITQYSNLFFLVLLVVFGVYWDDKNKSIRVSALFFVALIVINFINGKVLKNLIGRVRPCHDLSKVIEREPCEDSFGHPSNHSALSMGLATILEYFYPQYKYPILAVPTLVGLSRVIVGNHYPLDVLMGFLVGRIVGKLLIWLYINFYEKTHLCQKLSICDETDKAY